MASVWPLQGHGNQRLRAHTLTSQDARDRVGLEYLSIYKYMHINTQILKYSNTQIQRFNSIFNQRLRAHTLTSQNAGEQNIEPQSI